MPGSVDAFERFVEIDEKLLSLEPAPQPDRPPLQAALFREAVVFDHPLDAFERIACVDVSNGHHTISVPPAAGPILSPIAQHGACGRDHTGWMTPLTPTTTRDQDIRKGATEDGCPTDKTNAPGLDHNGLPNDEKAIAEDAVGAREDGTQG